METKMCPTCTKELDVEAFEWKNKEKTRRSSWCKDCTREYKKKYYNERRQTFIERAVICNAKRRGKLRAIVFNYLETHPCIDCGEPDPIVLDFDHRIPDEKIESISRLISNFVSEEKLLAEIEKCDVRCANCHRRKTAKQLNFYADINEMDEAVQNSTRRKRRNPKNGYS